MVSTVPQCRIGTSGFHYRHWKKIFYPESLPTRRWFEFYAQRFDTLEVNNTFYRVPDAATFEQWRDQTPPGFLYALKFSRFATHNKKLLTPEQTLACFLDRAAPLLPRTGPILLQLPPRWRANPERLDEFLSRAPTSHRWAVEMREPSWLNPEVYTVLERHQAALCIHDIIPDHPRRLTANWTYLRFHGAGAGPKYAGDYTEVQLKTWATRIRRWLRQGVDVYAYFNNDTHGHAITNAIRLRELLKLEPPRAAPSQTPGRSAGRQSPARNPAAATNRAKRAARQK